MNNKLATATTLASVLFLSTSFALAQNNNEGTSPDAASPMAPGENATPHGAGTSFGGYIIEPSKRQITASAYVGKPLYNSADESLGHLRDLIVEKDGNIVAAVVGVGGVMGVAEKNVALRMDKIAIAQSADGGEMRLTTNETADSLKSAPEFRASDPL